MGVYRAIILAVMLWRVDGAAALKCNDNRLKFLQAGHLDKGSVHWEGTRHVNVRSSVHWEECRVWESVDWECNYFYSSLKLAHQK